MTTLEIILIIICIILAGTSIRFFMTSISVKMRYNSLVLTLQHYKETEKQVDKLILVLRTMLINKPIGVLDYPNGVYLKSTFRIQEDGSVTCRVRDFNTENAKRSNMKGELGYMINSERFIKSSDLSSILNMSPNLKALELIEKLSVLVPEKKETD